MKFGHFKQNLYSDRVVILNLTCRVLLCCVCDYTTWYSTVTLQKVLDI